MNEEQEKTGRTIPSLLVGVGHLGALWALTIVQPMLSLLGDSPEFFVARDNSPGQVIVYVLTLTFGVPLIALVVEFIAEKINPRLRWYVHLGLMALIGSMLALQLVKRYIDLLPAGMILISLLIGAIGTLCYARFRFPRAFMDILIPAPIVLLAIFFFFSPASAIVLPKGDPEPVELEIGNPAPVVVISFDEFPLASLMKDRDSIDGSRYPNFAALADQSDWYLNASAAGAYTPVGLPPILTGRDPGLETLPVASEYRESIFTLLGSEYDMNVHELVTQICPANLCPEGRRNLGYESDTGTLFADLFVVSQHLLLPKSMRENLPDVSRAFGGFGEEEQEVATRQKRGERGGAIDLGKAIRKQTQVESEQRIADFVKGLDGESGPGLNFLHLMKPHYPWRHIPDGQSYTDQVHEWGPFIPQDRKWVAPQRVVDIAAQRGLLEVGYTDTLLGEVRDALEARDLWDDAVVVVTADHGAGFTAGAERRKAARNNLGEVASIPLFFKAPGQTRGEIVTDHHCAKQILPKIARELEIDYPWKEADCRPDEMKVLNPPEEVLTASPDAMTKQRNRVISRIQRLFTTGTGWGPVFRSGPRKELIGRPVTSFELSPPQAGRIAVPDDPNAAKDYDPNAPNLPGLLQRGGVEGVDEGEVVAVAVNGRVEGVGWTFDDRRRDNPSYSVLLDPSSLDKGFNQVDTYLVGGDGRSLSLLHSGAGTGAGQSGT